MNVSRWLIAGILSLSMVQTAHAFEIFKPYLGTGVGAYTFTVDTVSGSGSDQVIGAYLSAGVDLLPFLGVEGRIGKTDSVASLPSTSITNIRADYMGSVLGKVQLPFPNGLRFYGLAGMTFVKLNIKTATTAASDSTFGKSVGAGVDMKVSDHYRVGAEFVRYWHETDNNGAFPAVLRPVSVDIDSLVFTLQYEF